MSTHPGSPCQPGAWRSLQVTARASDSPGTHGPAPSLAGATAAPGGRGPPAHTHRSLCWPCCHTRPDAVPADDGPRTGRPSPETTAGLKAPAAYCCHRRHHALLRWVTPGSVPRTRPALENARSATALPDPSAASPSRLPLSLHGAFPRAGGLCLGGCVRPEPRRVVAPGYLAAPHSPGQRAGLAGATPRPGEVRTTTEPPNDSFLRTDPIAL